VCDSAVLPHPAHHIYPGIGLSPGTLPHLAHPCAMGTSGHSANGISYAIKQLATSVIVFVQPLGYKHFAVLRGIDRGRVFLADPARGNLRMSMGRFLSEWGGIVFVLDKAREEKNTTNLLALPRPEYVQPELLSVGRRVGVETFSRNQAVRPQLR
jgi:ABC-type bacteriocin/lantibiotic exporter with double-glycine peptidase domain